MWRDIMSTRKKKVVHNDDKYLTPPGTDFAILEQPIGQNSNIEVAITKDHRFAFYYWFKWWKKNQKVKPALITIDWHRDLFEPSDPEKEELQKLDLDSYREVALFSWDKLHTNNDGHVLSAAYLGFISDIYVLCKQKGFDNEEFIDKYGAEHNIKCFYSKDLLYEELQKNNHSKIYFDIDLDYFTESNELSGAGDDVKIMDKADIVSILDPNTDFMKWIFERMSGMTIATEPKYCGGLLNSNKIYDILDTTLFDPQLFSQQAEWKHLKSLRHHSK